MRPEAMPPDDYEYDRPVTRSGAVTAVAVVNFVLGGLEILMGLLIMVVGGTLVNMILGSAAGAAGAPQPGVDPVQAKQAQDAVAGMGGAMTALMAGVGFCIMIFGVPMIIAGIGVHKRRPWGRILTLVLAGLSAVGALGSLLTLNIVGIVVNGGYCAVAFAILLQKKYAAEFR